MLISKITIWDKKQVKISSSEVNVEGKGKNGWEKKNR